MAPLGEVLAAPVFDQLAILDAEIDDAPLMRSKMDFDPVGHYARPDVFTLLVDRRAKDAVRFIWSELARSSREPRRCVTGADHSQGADARRAHGNQDRRRRDKATHLSCAMHAVLVNGP